MIEDNRYYWSHLKTRNVTVRVKPKEKTIGLVFRVTNMIDIGDGRQTVILDHVDFPKSFHRRRKAEELAIPFKMGNLDFVYTSKGNPSVHSVQSVIETIYKEAQVEKIVPEVLCPGDLLVFKQSGRSMKIKMIEALRVIKETQTKGSKAGNAL